MRRQSSRIRSNSIDHCACVCEKVHEHGRTGRVVVLLKLKASVGFSFKRVTRSPCILPPPQLYRARLARFRARLRERLHREALSLPRAWRGARGCHAAYASRPVRHSGAGRDDGALPLRRHRARCRAAVQAQRATAADTRARARAMLTHGMRPGAPVHVHPPPACCTFQRRRAACPSLQERRRTVLRPCSDRAAWWPAGAAFVRGRQLRPGGLRWVPAGDPQPRAWPRRRAAQGALRQAPPLGPGLE